MGVSSGLTEEKALKVAAGVCLSGSQGKVGVGASAGVKPGWVGGKVGVSDKEGNRRSSQRQGLMEAETLSCSQRGRGLVHSPSPTEECVLGWARHMAAHPPSESQPPTLLLKWGLLGG